MSIVKDQNLAPAGRRKIELGAGLHARPGRH